MWLYYSLMWCVFAASAASTMNRCTEWRSELSLFTACARAQPRSSKCHFGLGNALRYSGRDREAVGAYREAIRIFPAHSDAYTNLGISLATLQDTRASHDVLQKALALSPTAADAYEQLAHLHFNDAQPSKAVRALEICSQIRPLSFFSLNLKGAASLQLGQLAAAKEAFTASLKLNGKFAETYNNLGILMQESGEHRQAAKLFKVSSELREHSFKQPIFNLGVSLFALGDVKEALLRFKDALALDGEYVRAYVYVSMALERLGHYEDAESALRTALRIDPANNEAYARLKQLKLSRARAGIRTAPH
eukprot:TRINITY_DN3834_c0_g1_i2.p2 TRINITY_DN3834_c0_g1~~TRINITY_DN3834_c0_g1_i2.p2  ORF type:complete len:307 (-),score=55.15 TRINITY_DN3834_c0_g1_i2:205-1125(-)